MVNFQGSLLCSLSNPMLSKVSMVYKMKSKKELLETRQRLPSEYHFSSHIDSVPVVNFGDKQTTSYRNNNIQIVGRDQNLQHLMDSLMEINTKELTIISIVGPVGLGKTSLAQLVFNDTRAETFKFRIWVHVSMGHISLEKIGEDIVRQTPERIEESMQMQSIKNAVQNILHRYRCLIVLDSLWGKDEEVNQLKQMLLTGRKTESKIIVTTHSSKVAELISTVPPYKLSFLSEDDCSSIFSQRAMIGHSDPLFREYGKEIVRRCEGIPLVANFLGSVVNVQRQRREIWEAAKDKDMWKIEEDYPENKILPIFPSFKIIYYSMPHELRLCFVYCSIFPKGYAIDKKKLIQQWIALDMIESKHGTLPLDVTAEKYIDELKDIYFLQVRERPRINAEIFNNSDEMLCVNNLAHDLARSVAGENILLILDAENERCNRNYDYRYARVSASSLQSIDSKDWPSKARSLIFKTNGAELQHVSEVLSVNKYLRVLDLSGCSVKEIPASVFQLKQLRYLDASTLSITDLPPQISGFHKLQTLDLSETEVTELPAFIGNIQTTLNYLNLQRCQKLQELNNLNLLHELHYLNLSGCPEVKRFPASLKNLRKLRFLNLSECSKLPTLPDELLQSFSSFSSIEDLNLSGFQFRMLPDFFKDICSLQFLNLSKCSKLELLPKSFGQLACLKDLNLSFCSDLKLPESFENLTSLQFLNLSHCRSVEYLPSSFDKLSNLEYLGLSECVGLKALPNHKKLQIEVVGCQDCIVQSCSLSSGSCQSHQCSQQVEEVGTSRAISDITPKEPANRDKTEGISASDVDEVDYPRNNLKQKLIFDYHMDEQKSEEPDNKLNSNGETVQVIPGHQIPSSPSRFSSIASSSSAVFASGSYSDVSIADLPLSNDDTAGLMLTKSNHLKF
ncbi:putative disease resistance protein RGA1 [Dichanthelium oligosanthes]|uniref:Putative disease resistance protein RGA1 n=1 Tax=Dichanthelium oligosanthes TaxID=888268 RepID=A0A1E5UR35_9POAL|nr:putative disease resistance protein RGA1 [Dichanthelium oligosanthes]